MVTPEAWEEAQDVETAPEQLRLLARKRALSRYVAANPATPPDLLDHLGQSPRATIRQAVASNPNTPPERLERLVSEFPQAVLNNAVFPLLLIERPGLLSTLPPLSLQAMVRDGTTTARFIKLIASQGDDALRAEAQQHIALAGEAGEDWRHAALQAMAAHLNLRPPITTLFGFLGMLTSQQSRWLQGYPAFAEVLARNPVTPPEVLSGLAVTADVTAMSWIARHPATPPATLLALASAPQVSVRVICAQNSQLPESAMEIFAFDSEVAVREAIAQHPKLPRELMKMLSAELFRVRQVLAARPDLPLDLIREFAEGQESDVRQIVALNPSLPDAIALVLARDPVSSVRQRLALNPAISSAAFAILAQNPDPVLEMTLIACVQQPLDRVLSWLRGENLPRRLEALRHPRLSEHHLEHVVDEVMPKLLLLPPVTNDGAVALAVGVAHHPNTATDVLQRLSRVPQPAILLAIATHPRTPPTALHQLARSEDVTIRAAVARHPNTAPRVLEKLMPQQIEAIAQRSAHTVSPFRSLLSTYLKRALETEIPIDHPDRHVLLFAALLLGIAPHFPPTAAEHLAWQERYARAINPHTALRQLEKFTHEGNRFVRAAARTTIHQVTLAAQRRREAARKVEA